MKVAIYARVSTEEQDYGNQLIQLREYCQIKGYGLYHEYIDMISGAKGEDERPNFKLMLKHASQRKFDLLLFWALDRLTREGAVKTLNYLQQIESYGVQFRSYTEQYLDSTGIFRDAVISILATVANQERVRHLERVHAGIERKKKAGFKFGRPVIDNTLQSQILELKAQKLSDRQIAAKLNIGRSTVNKYAKLNILK